MQRQRFEQQNIAFYCRPGMLATWLLSLMMLFLPSPAVAQSSDADAQQLARQIRQAVSRLHDLREQSIEQKQQHEAQQAQLAQQLDRLKQDVAKAQADRQQAQQRVEQLQQAIAYAKQQQAQADQQIAAALEAAQPMAQAMHQRALVGIPSMQQRGQTLSTIAVALQNADPDALADWHTYLSDQLRLNTTIDLDNRLVDLPADGIAKHAYVLRLGTANELYLTEDGTAMGIAARRDGTAWHTALSSTEQAQVRQVMAIVRQRQPVSLVTTPVMLRGAGGRP